MLNRSTDPRLRQIDLARSSLLHDGRGAAGLGAASGLAGSWIERSWLRCLARGQRPEQPVGFELVPAQAARRSREANRTLVQTARPVLERLARAIADTRYFAILTDAGGVVIDANGPVDRSDRRAALITRIGADLSERSVGTTAIGAALTELQPVWLHRGEHFFHDTSVYSCAGAPLFGPDGACVGMLDLTGIEVPERTELKHLVAQAARSIENALTLGRPHRLLLRLNWPGRRLGDEGDGLVCLDAEGWVTGSNPAARQMVPQLAGSATGALHASELFALPFEALFDCAQRGPGGDPAPLEVPLWSGLRVHLLGVRCGRGGTGRAGSGARAMPVPVPGPVPLPLKDMEIALIRKAVDQARGNVQQAARALGISRATVYRKLGRR